MKTMWNILIYFMGWGIWHSAMFCVLMGTAAYPLGIVITPYSGFIDMGWFVCALIVMLYHALNFSQDVDLSVYRRRVARRVVIWIVPSILLFLVIVWLAAPVTLLSYALGILVVSPFILWVFASMAFTARQYPLWIVQRTNTHLDPLTLPSATPSIASERNRLLQHIHGRSIFALIGLPAAFMHVYHINSAAYLFPCDESTRLVQVLFLLVAVLFTAYCAEGNATLITFVKVLILEDYFPNISLHWHLVILTVISFLYTLVTTWWTLILAPLYALFIAYHVYHTLALPQDGHNKAKRKEKLSAELVTD